MRARGFVSDQMVVQELLTNKTKGLKYIAGEDLV